jgi:hypothetical protein
MTDNGEFERLGPTLRATIIRIILFILFILVILFNYRSLLLLLLFSLENSQFLSLLVLFPEGFYSEQAAGLAALEGGGENLEAVVALGCICHFAFLLFLAAAAGIPGTAASPVIQ